MAHATATTDEDPFTRITNLQNAADKIKGDIPRINWFLERTQNFQTLLEVRRPPGNLRLAAKR